jgi:hypothetical protein
LQHQLALSPILVVRPRAAVPAIFAFNIWYQSSRRFLAMSCHSDSVIHRARPFSLSPPPYWPCQCGGECVIKGIVEKVSSNVVYPTLTRSNYTEWSLIMMVNLQNAGLWDVIESGAGDYREDYSALAAILRAVPQEMQAGLAVKQEAHDAWEARRRCMTPGKPSASCALASIR